MDRENAFLDGEIDWPTLSKQLVFENKDKLENVCKLKKKLGMD